MIPPDDISAGLPAPRDDEPRALRSDITDELADHLACSAARERLRDIDQPLRSDTEVLAAVLERFGNPNEVARRLWWDAMKEKIMTQRILSGVTIVVAVAAVLSSFFTYRLLATNYSFMEPIMLSQREMTQAMVAELHTLRNERNVADSSAAWQSLSVQLIDEADQPVMGKVICQKSGDGSVRQDIATDENGVADFGQLPTGQYEISAQILSPGLYSGTQSILLGPGRATEYIISCPSKNPPQIAPQFEINPPDDLANEALFYVAQMSWVSRRVNNQLWHYVNAAPLRYWLLDAHGKTLGELPVKDIEVRQTLGGGTAITTQQKFTLVEPLRLDPTIPAGEYLINVMAYVPVQPQLAHNQALPELRLVSSDPLVRHASLSTTAEALRLGSDNSQFWYTVRQLIQQPKSAVGLLGSYQAPAAPAMKGTVADPYAAELPPAAATVAPTTMLPSAQPTSTPATSSQSLRVTLVDESGKPAQGTVQIEQGTVSLINNKEMRYALSVVSGFARPLKTGPDGVVDFGRLPTGPYELTIVSRNSHERTYQSVVLSPDRPAEIEVECPAPLPAAAPVRMQIAKPESSFWHDHPLWFLVQFVRKDRECGGRKWSSESTIMLADGDGNILGTFPHHGPGWYAFFDIDTAENDVRFPTEVLQKIPLGPADGLPPGDYEAVAVAYAPEFEGPAAGIRPSLRVVSGVDVVFERVRLDATTGGNFSFGPEKTEFWSNIEKELKERELEEQKAEND